jgi:diaminopimelate decarboxylase
MNASQSPPPTDPGESEAPRWADDAVSAHPMLARTDGRLTIDGVAVDEIVARFGSPVYVVSESTLRARAREAQAAMAAAWAEGDVLLLPSVKANPVVALQRVLAEEGCGCDLFGGAELEVAVRAGIDPQRISVNGSAKDAATIERAVALGARITIDDVHEIELARAAAQKLGRSARLSIRLRPQLQIDAVSDGNAALSISGTPVLIRDAYARYKPGVPSDDLDAAAQALDAPELDLIGAMMHFPRHTTDLAVIGHVASRFTEAIAELSERLRGWRPRCIDVGGGFSPAGDPFGRALPGSADRPPAPSIGEYAATIGTALRAGLRDRGIDPAFIQLEIEPGRWMFGPCGIHVTSVRNVKRQSRPFAHAWVETDTTQHFLPSITGERCRFPVTVADMPDQPRAPLTADIVGRSCQADVLAPGERLPLVAPDDLLVFCGTGAYQEVGAGNFNAMPRPGTVLVTDGKARLVRRAETIDDVLGRDIEPSRSAAA